MDSIKFAKLRWACRRGMLELDLIFENYMDQFYAKAPEAEQHMFEELLSCNDQELYNWLIKREPSAKFAKMVDILLKNASAEH
ncbi:MAG: hypothetical protein K0S29_1082 [Gammaproteobacteria bacterium]|jgi:antitoxin CptB|nr:hypothetical protein [Gammaproteobacteria bacterium]